VCVCVCVCLFMDAKQHPKRTKQQPDTKQIGTTATSTTTQFANQTMSTTTTKATTNTSPNHNIDDNDDDNNETNESPLNNTASSPSDTEYYDYYCASPPSGITRIPLTPDFECLVSMEEINNENYVEYQTFPSHTWHTSYLSQAVVEQLLQTQFETYMNQIQSADCQAELRRLLARGPPIYISDPHGLPLPGGVVVPVPVVAAVAPAIQQPPPPSTSTTPLVKEVDTHIVQLWYASDRTIRSAILHNAVEGEEHVKLWNQLKDLHNIHDTTTTTSSTDLEGK
jgi:hypothetical protein